VDYKKLANILFYGGLILLFSALIWWWRFYGPMTKDGGAKLGDMLGCLYSNSGLCGLATGLSQLTGQTAYEPKLFWVGLVAAVVGGILKATRKSDD
jgi:hypothetical protein